MVVRLRCRSQRHRSLAAASPSAAIPGASSIAEPLLRRFIRFIGITADSKERRIIISQPDIIGRPPTWDEIDDWFLRQGFAKLNVKSLGGYDAVAFAGHGVGVFDVRPVNVVMSSDGILLPIDVMMRRMSKTQVLRLHRLDDPTAEALIRAINKSRESGAGTLAELRNPFED